MRLIKLILVLTLALFAASCNRDPKVARQKFLDSGNRYFNNGKYKEASIMYRRSLQKDMRFGEAYYRLGLCELRLGRPVEAIGALRRAIELQPENQDAAARLAELFLAAYSGNPNRPQQFIKEIEDLTKRILDKNPRSYDGLRMQGYLALIAKDLPGAIKSFETANAVKPNQPDLILVLAQSLIASQRGEDAEKLVKTTLQREKGYAPLYDLLYGLYGRTNRIGEAEAILKLKSSNNPRQPLFILQLAAHYFSLKNQPQVQTELNRILNNIKDFPTGHLLVGDFYYRTREFDKSIAQFKLGLGTDTKNTKLYQKRTVEVLVAQGKRGEASNLVAEILKADPKDNEGLAMRASLLLATGKPQEIQNAINDLQSVISRQPDNHVLRFNLARALLAKGDIEQARVQLLEAIKLRPDFVLPRLALAQVYVTKGDFPKAVESANEVLKFDRNNVPAKLLRSSAMIGMREYVQARQELDTLLTANPNLTDAQFQLGMVNYNEGKFKEAESVFRRLYQSAPQDRRGLMGSIEALVGQNQFAQAIEMIQSELQKTPERDDLRLALANTALRSGNLDMAVAEFKRLTDKLPKSPDLQIRLGEAYRRKGDVPSALQAFEKARELAPNNPVPTLTLAMMLDTTGQSDKSRPYYEQVLRLEPDNPMALNNLAYIMAESGTNLDEALTMVTKAKQKMPTNPEVSDTEAWIYIKKNLSDNAIRIYRDLVSKHPQRSTYKYHLAMAYYQKGDKPQAKKILEQALTNKPAEVEEKRIRELIAKCG